MVKNKVDNPAAIKTGVKKINKIKPIVKARNKEIEKEKEKESGVDCNK